MEYSLDMWEVLTRLIKYILEGVAVAAVASILPKTRLQPSEILLLALTAACVFSILDLMSPSVSASARQGVGLGAGFKLIGFR